MIKPTTKFQILFWLSALNLIFLGYALPDPLHAGAHGLLALGFGFWARRVRQDFDDQDSTQTQAVGTDNEERMQNLGADVSELRRQLAETQERLDFAERLLVQEREARRVEPQR
jgi:hypothetical protein